MQTAVHRIWKAFGLQPHRLETWKLSKDPQFIEKVRDVVGLYLNPPERAVVLCVDEKSQIQALGSHRADPADAARHARSAPPTTTSAPAPRASMPRWTSRPARSSARCTRATARSSSSSSCRRIDREVPRRARRPPRARQQPQPTRRPRSSAGWRRTHASSCTSRRPVELVAEPRRALVRRTDHQEAPPRRAPLRPRSSTPTSAPGSRPGTTTPSPSSGPRPPTKSSTPSPATARESTNHDTSSAARRSSPGPCRRRRTWSRGRSCRRACRGC